MKLFRIILAAPFVLIGAAFYKVGELISGEIYTRHEDVVERNLIFKHKMHQVDKLNTAKINNGGKGFRQPKRKK